MDGIETRDGFDHGQGAIAKVSKVFLKYRSSEGRPQLAAKMVSVKITCYSNVVKGFLFHQTYIIGMYSKNTVDKFLEMSNV